MNAVVLAGGFGSRLKPLTDSTPKPMVSVANMPMLDYTVSHLYNFGIRNVVYTLGYYPEQITDWAKGYRDVSCNFSVESKPLGTAGGVREAYTMLDDLFIVVSGDALENIDFNALMHKHLTSNAEVTMAVTHVKNPSLYGVVELDGFGTVTGFYEKPSPEDCKSDLVNCGIYIMNKRALELIPKNEKFDFARDLFPILLEKGKIGAFIHDGYWSDIGDVASYYASNFAMLDGGFFPSAYNYNRLKYESKKIGLSYPSLVGLSSSIVGECRSSIIAGGARIASGSAVDNCIVLENTVVKGRYINSIIGKDFAITVAGIDIMPVRQISSSNYKNFY